MVGIHSIQRFNYCLLQEVTVSHLKIKIYILFKIVNNKLLHLFHNIAEIPKYCTVHPTTQVKKYH